MTRRGGPLPAATPRQRRASHTTNGPAAGRWAGFKFARAAGAEPALCAAATRARAPCRATVTNRSQTLAPGYVQPPPTSFHPPPPTLGSADARRLGRVRETRPAPRGLSGPGPSAARSGQARARIACAGRACAQHGLGSPPTHTAPPSPPRTQHRQASSRSAASQAVPRAPARACAAAGHGGGPTTRGVTSPARGPRRDAL